MTKRPGNGGWSNLLTKRSLQPRPFAQRTLQKTLWSSLALIATVSAVPSAQTRRAPAETTRPAAWSQFRGTPRLTGVATGTPPSMMKLLWTYEAGDAIESSAAIVDGVVYVGAANGNLVAVDLAAGTLVWKYSTGSSIGESSPSVGHDMVYVGDLAGTLHAVGAHDGKPRWTFRTGSEIKSSPVVANDLVLVGSYDTYLYALDARDGKLRWKFQTQSMVHATPAVQDGLLYIVGCDEVFRAIRIADGKEVYRITAAAYTAASPVVDGDRAYFGTFGYEVLSLDLRRRKIAWRFNDPDRQFPYYSSAALGGGRLVVGGRDKIVRAIDAASGKTLWSFATKARVDSSPALAAGQVYIGSNDGRLYVLDLASGRKQWEFDAGAPLSASPAIAAGRVVIGSQDGRLYCFG